jgi:NDP-sugar pyrophosphorylase family protein
MQPLTADRPKAMVEVAGRPVIYWVLNWLKSHGIENIVIGVAYRKEVLIDYIRANGNFGLNVTFSEHSVEGETGEGFRMAISRYVKDENFIAMNGDELTNLNLSKMVDFHLKHQPIATIAVSPMRSPFGLIELYEDNITGFREKPLFFDKLVNAGVYVFNRRMLEFLPGQGPIEKTAFPKLAEHGMLKAYKLGSAEKWTTVNSIKDLERAAEDIRIMGWKA